ncbi:hypothetical protein ACO0RG_004058 [Hanseniaspora osmophila]
MLLHTDTSPLDHLNQNTETTRNSLSDEEQVDENSKQVHRSESDEALYAGGDVEREVAVDDGKTNLYTTLSGSFPFKTSETLLDEILNDIFFIKEGHGILKEPTIAYAKKRDDLFNTTNYNTSLLYLNDQITVQSNYVYHSKACPDLNKCKITVAMAALYENSAQLHTTDDIENIKIFHLKITVKEKPQMQYKLKDIERFHLVQYTDLHEFDKQDLIVEPKCLDSAIFVSPVTNKVIMIEILDSEFSKQDLGTLKSKSILERYMNFYGVTEEEMCVDVGTAKEKEISNNNSETTNRKPIPSQLQCVYFLFKIIKGALNEESKEAKKKIIKESFPLNTQIDKNVLLENFHFHLVQEESQPLDQDEDGVVEIKEYYEAPDMFDYESNPSHRIIRDGFVRKALEAVFLGQIFHNIFPSPADYNKYFRFFLTSSSPMFWFNLIGQYVGNPNAFLDDLNRSKYYNLNYNFISLNAFKHYQPHTIINNFKRSIELDPENTAKYYDNLEFVASVVNNKQLFQYLGTLDIVGHEALKKAFALYDLSQESSVDEQEIYNTYKTKKALAGLSSDQNDQNMAASLKSCLRTLSNYVNSNFLRFLVEFEPYSTVQEAYKILNLETSINDYDWIQTAYMLKVSDQPALKVDADRALFTVAIYLKSLPLFTLLFEQEPRYQLYFNNVGTLTIEQAYKDLGINENCTDDTLIEVFKANWNAVNIELLDVNYDQLLKLRRAFCKVSTYRNSKILEIFVSTGKVDESYLPSGNWPVGLCNVGNTCYLNSLLQFYFTIVPLRTYIMQYSAKMETLINENGKRRIGGREVSAFEVQRSTKFINQLRTLFFDMIHTNSKVVTPSQQLVYLAFAPSEFIQQDSSLSNNTKDDEKGSDEMEVTQDQLELTLEMGRQQDVTECIGNFLDQFETVTLPLKLEKDFEQYDLIKKIFYGVLKQNFIKVQSREYIRDREREERFSSLLVNLGSKPRNLYAALDQFFNDEEEIEISGVGKVQRQLELTELPLILQVQIQRVEFDKTRYIPIKNIDPLPFDEQIYMDKYVTNGVPLQAKEEYETKKSQLSKLKERQSQMLARNEVGQSVKNAISQTRKFLETDFIQTEMNMDTQELKETTTYLSQVQDEIEEKIKKLGLEISLLEKSIDVHFQHYQKHPYSLFAVFVHRGEASYGHYWIYIKDFEKNIWRKYNDETVSEVPESEVYNFTEGNTATPYFLAYIQDDHQMEIEPLKRALDD